MISSDGRHTCPTPNKIILLSTSNHSKSQMHQSTTDICLSVYRISLVWLNLWFYILAIDYDVVSLRYSMINDNIYNLQLSQAQHDDNRIIYFASVECCEYILQQLYYYYYLRHDQFNSSELILALKTSKCFFSFEMFFFFHFFFWTLMSCNTKHVNFNPFDGIIRSEFHANPATVNYRFDQCLQL